MTTTNPRPRSKLRDLTMGALLVVVLAGGLTALIARAESAARADASEPSPCDSIALELE